LTLQSSPEPGGDGRPEISACLCAHQPRERDLATTLDALRRQALAPALWELIVVDNASEPPLKDGERLDLGGLPGARLVREERLGLVRARLAALDAARGEVLVFVDDDNALAPDYLKQARRLMAEHPDLGAIGGRRRGVFEVEPPAWTRDFLPFLAVHEGGDAPRVAKRGDPYASWFPAGAGMVIRRAAMDAHARRLRADPARLALGRVGEALGGSEDVDMLMTVLDSGAGVGYFPELTLDHRIPATRLEYAYLRRLVFESMQSATRLRLARDPNDRPLPWPLEYLRAWALLARDGQWHPRAWALAAQVARGRYAALRSNG
jgi:glycosyltransferase involved in cell wall biosynthesis